MSLYRFDDDWLPCWHSGAAFVTPSFAAEEVRHRPRTDTEIKIGQTIPLLRTGVGLWRHRAGCRPPISAMINEQGGVGRPQDQSDPVMTMPIRRRRRLEQVRKLVESDEVLTTFQIIGTPPNRFRPEISERQEGAAASRLDRRHALQPTLRNFSVDHRLQSQLPSRKAHILREIHSRQLPERKRSAILYQNEPILGKDYVKGLEGCARWRRRNMIVSEASYELSDPTVDSQMVKLKASRRRPLSTTSPRRNSARSRSKKAAELGWKPVHILDINATPGEPDAGAGGPGECQGHHLGQLRQRTRSIRNGPRDAGMKRYKAFMEKYAPHRRRQQRHRHLWLWDRVAADPDPEAVRRRSHPRQSDEAGDQHQELHLRPSRCPA